MIALQLLNMSIVLIVLSIIHVDASSHRSVRQTTTNRCPVPSDIVVCDYVQCANGRCVEDRNSPDCFQCQCYPGYTGRLCDEAVVIPSSCNPGCQNGGQCIQTVANTFACKCPTGYTGTQCETSVSVTHPCVTMPGSICQNGGTCTMNGADYICGCAVGWTGKNCEMQETFTTCNTNPCGAHGTCVQGISQNGPVVFCNCENRWTGKYCDVNLDGTTTTTPMIITTVNPNVTMTTTAVNPNVTMTTTAVNPNATITTIVVNPNATMTTTIPLSGACSTNSCLNGGSCFNIGNTFICLCQQGWTGPRCDTSFSTILQTSTIPSNINACNPSPCYNGGSCFRHGNSYICVCKPQFTGSNCEMLKTTTISTMTTTNTEITCSNRPCQNGGTCFNTGNSYFCFCGSNSLYTGKNCETVSLPPATNCPLNCAPGYCINSGSSQNAYACMCNGTITPTSCSST
ncbi:unnamed protein product [Rotaria sp. Silwood1]|nr:unnamed protein product [Rotaria sp. Silwood1]